MSDISEDQPIASMESAITLYNADTLSYEHSIEQYVYAAPPKSQAIEIYQGLVAIENRIHAYGVSTKDVAALESLVPGILLNHMPRGGFTYAPSMQNVEVALERIDISKIALLVQAGGIVIELVNKIIDWIEKRYKQHRNKRAIDAAAKLNEAIKRKRTEHYNSPEGRATMAANVRAEREQQAKANGISKDTKTVATGGGGASHDSKTKYVNENIEKDKNLFKEIFIGRFGVSENSMGEFLRCTTVRDVFAFLNSHDAKGPSIFSNNGPENVKRLLTFINQSTMELDRLGADARGIMQQIDGYLMGNRTNAVKIEAMTAPLAALVGSGSDNLNELIKEGSALIQVWSRTGSLKGSAFLSNPEGMAKQITEIVNAFDQELVINNLRKYKDTYTKLVKEIQQKLERFAQSGEDQKHVQEVSGLVSNYMNQMQGIINIFTHSITLHGQLTDYMASLAVATATYVR